MTLAAPPSISRCIDTELYPSSPSSGDHAKLACYVHNLTRRRSITVDHHVLQLGCW
jgi:hypothetical protein